MKKEIAWHEECLLRMEAYHKELVKKANNAITDYKKVEKEINQLGAQIMAAKDLGIDAFDADKFGVKRK